MKNRSDPFPHDATVLDEPVRANGEDAPGDAAAEPSAEAAPESPPPPEPRIEAPAVSESEPASPDPAASPVPPPALLDLPIASVLPPMAPLLHTPADAAPLEARIQRLEAELAQLRTAPPRDPRAAGFQTAPSAAAAPVPRQPEPFWANLGKRLVAPSGPSASPPSRTDGLASMVPPGVRRGWMLWDSLTELRAMYWMFIDPRYRLSWTARLAPIAVLAMILTSGFWLPLSALPYVGFVLDKVADLALAYLLFKLLSYEARRYRETAPDLPPSLRL